MSLNVCTDLLLLQLVPRERIASISFVGHEAAPAALGRAAVRGVASNRGQAEDVVRDRPDLILAGALSTPVAKRLARRTGVRVVEVAPAGSFAQIRSALRQIGDAVGEPARAEALIAGMDRRLAEVRARRPVRPLRVVAWSGGGSVPGRATLTDAIIRAAGAVNIAAAPGANPASFGVEELLLADPDALLHGQGVWDAPSLQGQEGRHRAVRGRFAGRRVAYNEAAHTCGLPQSADSARAIQAALAALPPRSTGR